MKELIVNGETFISTKRAAEITGYTTDYVGQLARGGKVTAQLVGRNWYVEEESIKKHKFGSMSDSVQLVDEVPSAPELEVLIEEKEETIEEAPVIEDVAVVKEESGIISNTLDEMQNAWSSWYASQEVKDEHEGVVLSTEEIETLQEDAVPVHIEEEVDMKREDINTAPVSEDIIEEVVVPTQPTPEESVLSPYQEETRENDRSSLFIGSLALFLVVGLVIAGGFIVLRNDISAPANVLIGIEQYFTGTTEFQR